MKIRREGETLVLDLTGTTIIMDEGLPALDLGAGVVDIRNGTFAFNRSQWHQVVPIKEWQP
jgi:hypothetical protein